MKRTILIIALLGGVFNSSWSQNQNTIIREIDSIRYISGSLDSCLPSINKIIGHQKDAIKYLIEKIKDSTPTNVSFRCKLGNMTVGDISFFILEKMVVLPLYYITEEQFDVYYGGCVGGLYSCISQNRQKFAKDLKRWYEEDGSKLIWTKFEGKYLTNCRKKYSITGYYKMPLHYDYRRRE